MLQSGDLNDQITQIYSALTFLDSFTAFSDLRLEGFAFVFSKLLNKCVLHLVEEATVEFIPLSCLQVALLQLSRFSENVNLGTNKKVPALSLFLINSQRNLL